MPLLCFGFQTTYEELKRTPALGLPRKAPSFQTTYEELKHKLFNFDEHEKLERFQTTYEELKLE